MSYDSATDPLISALRSICKVEVTRALADTFGDTAQFPAVKDTFGAPVELGFFKQLQLPCMSVFVESIASRSVGKHRDQVLSVVFNYFAPLTPVHKLDGRWPMLRRVWDATLAAVNAGKLNGVDVLCAAGVQRVEDEQATLQIPPFGTDGDNAYPLFVGRIPIVYRPEAQNFSIETLADFDSILADINRVDGNPKNQPEVQALVSA